MARIKYPYKDESGSFCYVHKDHKYYKEYEDGTLVEAAQFIPPKKFAWRIPWMR